jgi:ATP-binding cassette subfamily C protein
MNKEQNIFNDIQRLFDIPAQFKIDITDHSCFYFLTSGELFLYFCNENSNKTFDKLRFINKYIAPCLIPVPKLNPEIKIVISTINKCSIQVLTADSISQAINQHSVVIAEMIESYIFKPIVGCEKLFSDSAQLYFSLTKKNIAEQTGSFPPIDTKGGYWLVTKPTKLKVFNRIETDDFKVFPATSKLWYQIEKGTEFYVSNTLNVLRTSPSFLSDYLDFYSVIFDIDTMLLDLVKQERVINVNRSIKNNNEQRETSYESLMRIANPKAKEVISNDDDDYLLACLKLIGKFEKINFKRVFVENPRYSNFENILRGSHVRSKQVKLTKDWFKTRSSAYLSYLDDNTPIALIPKGQYGYVAVNVKTQTKEAVTKQNAHKFENDVISFFTPFPDGALTAKTLIKFGFQFAKKDLYFFLFIGILSALLGLFVPISMGFIFDNVIPNGSVSQLGQIFILLVALAISMGIMNFAKSVCILRMEGILSYKIMSATWDRILTLKVKFFEKYASGDLATRSMGIDTIRDMLSGTIMSIFMSLIFSIFYLGLLFFYNFKFALLGLVLSFIISVFSVIISFAIYKHLKIMRVLDVKIAGILFQLINGVNKIRITNSGERAFNQWAKQYSIKQMHNLSIKKIGVISSVFNSSFPILATILLLYVAYKLLLAVESGFTVGSFIASHMAYLHFQSAILQASMSLLPILAIKPIFNLFKPILEADMENTGAEANPGTITGAISVCNASFRYNKDQPWIINNVNFNILPGEFIAIVGDSGAGKSTILRLLLGFEDLNSGQIHYDSNDINTTAVRLLRAQIGVVLQNGKMLSGTILSNIIGNSKLTVDDAWQAAKEAGCEKEIDALPDKMNTKVEPGGSLLSDGQIQRIIIAGAFVKQPKVLFLDEATSALDNESQKIITNSIQKLSATKVIIAHRLSTIRSASRILVLDNGHIIESGTYDELLKMHGFFADLVKRQFV